MKKTKKVLALKLSFNGKEPFNMALKSEERGIVDLICSLRSENTSAIQIHCGGYLLKTGHNIRLNWMDKFFMVGSSFTVEVVEISQNEITAPCSITRVDESDKQAKKHAYFLKLKEEFEPKKGKKRL